MVDNSEMTKATFENPYAAPQTATMPISRPSDFSPLASRWQRFAGSLIDGIALLIPYWLLAIGLEALGFWFTDFLYEMDAPFAIVWGVEQLVSLVLLAAIFLVCNFYLLKHRGQTIGKLLLQTQIVSNQNELVPVGKVFLMRYFLIWIFASIPLLGQIFNIANGLAIFRENRKCLHDDICNTKVIALRDN